MRVLLLAHSFNSLTQRLHVELRAAAHEVAVEYDVNDAVTGEAVSLFRPDVVLAPFLKRRIPAAIWRRVPCLVIHPGPPGDRGPSALDWAIQEGAPRWGVTVFRAEEELDAGAVYAFRTFTARTDATKSSLYRHEVTEAAVEAALEALGRVERGEPPAPADDVRCDVRGRARPAMTQADRAIDWAHDPAETVLRKIRAADGSPGVADTIAGVDVYLHDAHAEADPPPIVTGSPGSLIARRDGAVCRTTADGGAVWIGRLRPRGERSARKPEPGSLPRAPLQGVRGAEPPEDEEKLGACASERRTRSERTLKLPATDVLGEAARAIPEVQAPAGTDPARTYREIFYEEANGVGWLHFPFHNGAMSTAQCERLRRAYLEARARPTKAIVLMGGPDFWSNGIHLATIEAAESPADESWRNIVAVDDLAREIIATGTHLTIAALQGNAGGGGAFLALAADLVLARSGVVLNPHYKSMGNLPGSEYWTYLLPRRTGSAERARAIVEARLPMGTAEAQGLGLVDDAFGGGGDVASFRRELRARAEALARDPELPARLAEKRRGRAEDEARKPLEAYRAEELEHMKLAFYGFDPSYHVARWHFIFKVPKSRTPLHLAPHRRPSRPVVR